jgi:preprotein translocase subunit SecG
MNIVLNLVLILQIVTALVMIGLVLIQHGKGADMGASFGSGASGSLFGATGSANFLSRSTAVCAAVFFVCTLYLAYSANDRPRASTGSVLDRPAAAASAPRSAASGATAIPGPTGAAVTLPATVTTAASSAPVSASGAGAIPQK